MKWTTWFLMVLLLSCGAGRMATADVTIEMNHDGKSQKIFATDQKFCLEADQGMTIFRGDQKLLWVVNREDGTYFEITENDLKGFGEKLEKMKSEMAEAMKNLPPEQRAMAEKMMAGNLPAGLTGEEAKVTVKSLGQNKTINGFKASGYEVYHDDRLQEEVWAAEPKDLGLEPADFQVLAAFSEFLQAAVPGLNEMVGRLAKNFEQPKEDEVPGYPVLTIQRDSSGQETWRSELVRVDKEKVAADRFEVPKGLKKEKMELGR